VFKLHYILTSNFIDIVFQELRRFEAFWMTHVSSLTIPLLLYNYSLIVISNLNYNGIEFITLSIHIAKKGTWYQQS